MAQATKQVKTPQTVSVGFSIDDKVAVPPRTKEVPEYNIPFDKLTKGKSIMLPYSMVPKEHARLLVGRYFRKNELDFVTRTEKDADGDEIGLRIWHNGPKTTAE